MAKQSRETKPLTILAGANNSGKSSIMQPILMMKQTMEDVTDPVSDLLIEGTHVKYNTPDEFLTKINGRQKTGFSVTIGLDTKLSIENKFKNSRKKTIDLIETLYNGDNEEKIIIRSKMTAEELMSEHPEYMVFSKSFNVGFDEITKEKKLEDSYTNVSLNTLGIGLCVRRKRCLLSLAVDKLKPSNEVMIEPIYLPVGQKHQLLFEKYILDIIHVPAERGSPERSYKSTAVGRRFRGPIIDYVASILYDWKFKDAKELKTLEKWLKLLELTSRVDADRSSDNRIKIMVHRLPQDGISSRNDMVNITDVGFGTSQIIPVLIALLIAKKDQMVYIEQPEVHLHPKAQRMLAYCLAESAQRGVKVVVETHSEMLLLSIQTIVANKGLAPNKVALYWFKRGKNGTTNVMPGIMDKIGAYGDWPVDFADVTYDANREYLNATGFHIGK